MPGTVLGAGEQVGIPPSLCPHVAYMPMWNTNDKELTNTILRSNRARERVKLMSTEGWRVLFCIGQGRCEQRSE